MRRRSVVAGIACVLAVAVAVAVVGCKTVIIRQESPPPVVVAAPPVVMYGAPPPPPVIVVGEPPPMIVERPGPRPSDLHVWIGGYHEYRGGRYVWVPGRWDRPPRPAAVWVPPHYDRLDRGYRYTPGYWMAR